MFPDSRGVSPSVMAEITHYVLELWHEHRIPIIMSTLFVLSLLRIYLHSTQPKQELRALPKAYEKVAPNERINADEKPKPVVVKEDDSEGSESTGPTSEKRGTKKGPRRIKGDVSKKGRGSAEAEGEARNIQVLVFFSH
jgi:tRNA wybutosine-synthesizing protein 1